MQLVVSKYPKAVLDHNPCEPKRSEPTAPHSSDVAQCNSSQTGNSVQCGSSTADNNSHGIADDNQDTADMVLKIYLLQRKRLGSLYDTMKITIYRIPDI